ncbi:UNVERIFIED_CONTAM: hypothetical protein B566_EDAN019281 [Ephemera danica]|nr:hypothetical protein B566_EDAN019281 [Ephemera danica]
MERKIRWRSIRIVYFTMFMFSLSFSMSMTGIWPYLNKLDPSAGKEFLGLIVAAAALGQMIFSPIFGYWGNHAKNVRLPLIVSLPIIALTYVGSVVCRSYVAEATTIRERTGVISMIGLNLGLGMMLGQVSQVAVTPLGDEGIPLFGGTLWLNMYTAIAWINVVIQLVIFGVLMWPNMFIEQRIALREATAKHKESLEKQFKPEVFKMDCIAIWSVMIAFVVINLSIFETLGTSLAMDEFAWSREEALKFMSILMTCGITCNTAIVSIMKPLCRRFDERSVLIIGLALTAFAQYVNIPWGGSSLQLSITDETTNSTSLGCPVDKQPWCSTAPAMTVSQLVIAFIAASIAYGSAVTLCQTIFSKSNHNKFDLRATRSRLDIFCNGCHNDVVFCLDVPRSSSSRASSCC